jgi:hypothetical protein
MSLATSVKAMLCLLCVQYYNVGCVKLRIGDGCVRSKNAVQLASKWENISKIMRQVLCIERLIIQKCVYW